MIKKEVGKGNKVRLTARVLLENRFLYSLLKGDGIVCDVSSYLAVRIDLPVKRESTLYALEKLGTGIKAAEVGVFCGDNALDIVTACRPKELHLIDPWEIGIVDGMFITEESYEIATGMLEPFVEEHNIKFIKGLSVQESCSYEDGYFDYVYIDARHDYDSVKADILAWEPKVRPGGILAGHDWKVEDVEKAVRETLGDKFIVTKSGMEWIYHKEIVC